MTSLAHATTEPYVPIEPVAEILGVPKTTLYTWCQQGRVPHYKLGPHTLRFRLSEVQAWAETTAVRPPQDGEDERSQTREDLACRLRIPGSDNGAEAAIAPHNWSDTEG